MRALPRTTCPAGLPATSGHVHVVHVGDTTGLYDMKYDTTGTAVPVVLTQRDEVFAVHAAGAIFVSCVKQHCSHLKAQMSPRSADPTALTAVSALEEKRGAQVEFSELARWERIACRGPASSLRPVELLTVAALGHGTVTAALAGSLGLCTVHDHLLPGGPRYLLERC